MSRQENVETDEVNVVGRLTTGLQHVNTIEIHDDKSIHDVNNDTNIGGLFVHRRSKGEHDKEIVEEECYIAYAFTASGPL